MKNYISIFALGAIPWMLLTSLAIAQEPPRTLNDRVFVSTIAEHQVVIRAPRTFGTTQIEAGHLYEWANWACGLYKRYAVGALNVETDSRCEQLRDGHGNITFRGVCTKYYLFACAIP